MTAVAAGTGLTRPGWLRSYRLMIRFEVSSARLWLPMALLVQLFTGAGMAIMYGFYFGTEGIDERAIWITTGAPALALIPVGMVMVPNLVGEQRARQTYDFIWSLPVPRSAAAMALCTVFTALALPGSALAVALAAWRYGVDLDPTLAIVPAIVLTSLMATSVGYGIGQAIRNPQVVNLLTNILIFFVLLFSPIVVPITQFPGWFDAVHHLLPFWPMATVIRDALAPGVVDGVAQAYAVLTLWTIAGWAAAGWVVSRRR